MLLYSFPELTWSHSRLAIWSPLLANDERWGCNCGLKVVAVESCLMTYVVRANVCYPCHSATVSQSATLLERQLAPALSSWSCLVITYQFNVHSSRDDELGTIQTQQTHNVDACRRNETRWQHDEQSATLRIRRYLPAYRLATQSAEHSEHSYTQRALSVQTPTVNKRFQNENYNQYVN